jgi:F0F1-type ATP synthase delta subunit
MLFLFILLQVVIFIGLIFMFRRIMTQNVASATRHLDELNQEYTNKEKEVNRLLEEAKQKSIQLIKEAQADAEKLRAQVTQETQEEKDRVINQARTQSEEIMQQAEKSRQALLGELEERISKEATTKACELIQNTLPEKFKQEVHTHWLEELIKEGFSQLERLHVPQDVNTVKITSAFALDSEQRQALAKKLKSILGREMSIKEEVDPKVVAGLIISIGSLVLDGSLKNRIQEQAKNV